ncbi:MAG: T9SS type B sorting domain-containing protein [Bacteroidota bacterium]
MKLTYALRKTKYLRNSMLLLINLCCFPFLHFGQSTTVTVGSLGTSSESPIPVQGVEGVAFLNGFSENSTGVALYPAADLADLDIPLGSTLNGISFWVTTQGQRIDINPFEALSIFVANTTDTELTAGPAVFSVVLSGGSQVYNGSLPTAFNQIFSQTTTGFVEIAFDNGFTYNGNGLLIGTQNSWASNVGGFASEQNWLDNPIFGLESGLGGNFSQGVIENIFPNGIMDDLTTGTRPYIQLTFTPCVNESELTLITNSPSACIGESATLQATTSSGSIVWYADALGNTQLGTGNTFTTSSITANTTFYYRAEDTDCHSRMQSVTVTALSVPNSPSANDVTICEGESATFTASGGSGSYIWFTDADGNFPQNSGTTFTTPALNTTTTYFVGSDNSDGCVSNLVAVEANVVSDVEEPIPASSNVEVCAGDIALLSVSTGGSNGTFTWFDDITGLNQVNTGPSFTTPVITSNITYYVRETTAEGCESDLEPITVTLASALSNPSASGVTVCPNGTATLTATTGGANGTFTWTYLLPDETSATLTGSTVTIADVTSNLSVNLVEATGNCTSGTVTVQVTVDASISAPSVSDTTICANTTVTLMATSGGANGTFQWFDDAAGSNLVSSSNPFTTPSLTANTSYYVKEVSEGCESDLVQVDVTVTTVATPVISDTTLCNGESIILVASAPGTITWFDDAVQTNLLATGSNFFTGTLTSDVTYFLNQTEGGCISDLTSVTVSINTIPTDPTLTGATICAGNTATLTASGDAGSTFQWFDDNAGTNLLAEGDTYVTGPLFATTTFFAKAMNNGCESGFSSVAVLVNDLPASPTVDSTVTEICSGDIVTLNATSGGANGTIEWYSDADLTDLVNSGASFTTPSLTEATIYFVREVDDNLCFSPSTAVQVVIADPLPAPSIFSTSTCADSTATLTATTGGTNGDFVWFADADGTTELFTGNPFETPNLSVNTSFWVAETDGSCLSDLVKVDVLINPNPVDPIADDVTICAGEDATLTASSGGSNGSLGWFTDLEGTNQVSSSNPLVIAGLSADTTLFLIETLGTCRSNSVPVTVTVETTPANPSAMDVTICEGDTAVLTAVSGGSNGTFAWFDDPAGLNQVSTNTVYEVPNLNDNETFFLQETLGNCSSDLVSVDVTVNSTPDNPTGVGTIVCEGDSATLTAFSSIGTINWYFFEDATSDTLAIGDTLVTEVLESTTPYFIQETSTEGCVSDFVQVTATVTPTPATPTVATDTEEVCEGETAILSALTIENAIYNWTGPNGFVSNAQTPEIADAATTDAGEYSVTATVDGCVSDADTTTLLVNTKPTVTAGTVGSNSPICEGTTLQLFAPTLSNVSYEWTFPDGTISNDQNPFVTDVIEEDDQGFYNLVLTNNSTGCQSDVISTLVMIFDVPEDIQAGNNSPVCEGESVQFTSSTFFGASYEWTDPFGNVFSSEQNPVLSGVTTFDAGTYTVTITTEDGCQITQTGSTTVDINENPTADAGLDQSITEDLTAQLAASGGVSYQWAPIDNLDNGNLPNPVFAAPIGVYTLTVEVFNEAGCSSSDSLTVTVLPQTELVISDVFTPNGDGINDTWNVEFIQNLSEAQVIVFNRAGFKVLQSDAYLNDWDGTFEGNNVPDGTYWYVIRTTDREYKGALTIKR